MTPRLCPTLALLALVLSGCQRQDDAVSIAGKLFNFNYRVATATYVLTLARQGPLPEGSTIETTYENPAGGAPLVVREKIFASWEKIALNSPPVHCIVKDRPYRIAIRILGPDGALIQALETTLTSNIDQTVMPAKPLVVGPFYTRNPQVFKADGSTDFSPETGCKN